MAASGSVSERSSSVFAQSTDSMPRLAVAWQNPETRHIQPVGLLWHHRDGYRFRYIANVSSVAGFAPFLSFPDLRRVYRSTRLFPLFEQRVMDPGRPDFTAYVRTLDLAESATPWEQLVRSEGRRAGDTIMVFPEPFVSADGFTACKFLIHGIRHATAKDSRVEMRLAALEPGDRLVLRTDDTNAFNPRAIHAVDSDVVLGWVPDLLLDYAHEVVATDDYLLEVRHINPSSVPVHLRLLVDLRGRLPVGYQPFGGPKWSPVTDASDDG